MKRLFEQASFSHSRTQAHFEGAESNCFLHCENKVLSWHEEHPSHQFLHASTVPGSAGGQEGGPFKTHYCEKVAFRRRDPKKNHTLSLLCAWFQNIRLSCGVVRYGWLKDAQRPMPLSSHVLLFTEQIKGYNASYITVTVYCIIFINLFFCCKGWI